MRKIFHIIGVVLCLMIMNSANIVFSAESDIERIKTITEIGTLFNSGHYDEALEKCNIAMKKYPKDAELYYWRASTKSHLGDNKSAIKDYTEAIRINPKDGNAYVMRGIIKTELKDFSGAIADYNHAIMLNSKDSSAYSMRACAKLEMGDIDGASKDLEIANKLYDEGK